MAAGYLIPQTNPQTIADGYFDWFTFLLKSNFVHLIIKKVFETIHILVQVFGQVWGNWLGQSFRFVLLFVIYNLTKRTQSVARFILFLLYWVVWFEKMTCFNSTELCRKGHYSEWRWNQIFNATHMGKNESCHWTISCSSSRCRFHWILFLLCLSLMLCFSLNFWFHFCNFNL